MTAQRAALIDTLPGLGDGPTAEDRVSDEVKKARREITTARKRAERAREAAREADLALARAVARAPRTGPGPRARGADVLTVDELGKLAGVESREGVYKMIRRAEQDEAGGQQ